MAKKKQIDSTPKIYVYYDKKTGEIFSVTNEISTRYDNGVVMPYSEVEKLLSGEWRFIDYKVGYKDINDKSALSILPSDYYNAGYTFKNNLISWVKETSNDAECIVEWNNVDNAWYFYLSSDVKNSHTDTHLIFFATLETDFDFLIRTIVINVDNITSGKVKIPFESNFEHKIDKISLSTKNVFKSYKLKVIHDN